MVIIKVMIQVASDLLAINMTWGTYIHHCKLQYIQTLIKNSTFLTYYSKHCMLQTKLLYHSSIKVA